ncbi:MAG TPA: M23 family metallopeptidase, partial [Deltaproteobacteria bacterium]|nr:M23 family metallopeptidase [Deltaproteobacteria bacterium]
MLLALLALDATAITPPATGAVALPGGVDLTLPFPDETPVRVSCGYGPGCSVFHSGTNAPGSTNDYHALDLVRDQAGGGDGLPVVAAFSGTVVYADWATGGWSTFGRIVLIEHDLGDGHTYMSLYAHLSSLSVSAGEVVADKDEVGTMGGSGNFGDNYFTPHLHFSLYRDAAFAGGPYGGNAVVPELIDGYGDLVQGDLLVAGPGAGSVSAVIVDNSDPGFALSGPATQHNSGGYRSSFWYE